MTLRLKSYVLYCFVCALVVSLFGLADVMAEDKSKPELFAICRNKKTVRTVRVTVKDGICETIYSKEGSSRVVGSGKSYQSCAGFFSNIKTNLHGAGWICKDVSASNVTDSESLGQ